MHFGLMRAIWKGGRVSLLANYCIYTARREPRPPINEYGIGLKSNDKRYNLAKMNSRKG